MKRPHHIKSLALAKEGSLRIEWAGRQMPVLQAIRRRFERARPLRGIRVAACLHVTTETAHLAMTLVAGGASVAVCASNPLSTQDDVAAALVRYARIPVFALNGENTKTYYAHLDQVLDTQPQITMDDGADLVSRIHTKRRALARGILGGTEETTTGVIRLRSLERKQLLLFPIIAVNDTPTKHFFDNRYGTGQSTIDAIIRSTNRLLAGSTVVVAGYGWCGRGVAMRARGMGAQVIVTEINPLPALEAVMDGYQVLPMNAACRQGDIFVTVTGDREVIRREHVLAMKDGAIICNAGHFNVEIDLQSLERLAVSKRRLRPHVDEYTLRNKKRIVLLGEGRLVNLVAAEGHPAAVMDMSFANQALAAEHLVTSGRRLMRKVYEVPKAIDDQVARLKLKAMGVTIDRLTPAQRRYLTSWELGTE